jgi:hypothetical protein
MGFAQKFRQQNQWNESAAYFVLAPWSHPFQFTIDFYLPFPYILYFSNTI